MTTEPIWAIAGAVVLVLIYQHLRVTWPESYFGPVERIAFVFSRTGPRFLMFRLLPPYLVFVTVGVYGPVNGTATVVLCGIIYVVFSSTLSVIASVREAPNAAALTTQRIMVLIAMAISLGGCAWLAVVTVPSVRRYAPGVGEIVANLVSAALAAVLVVSFVAATRTGEPVRRTLSPEMLQEIQAIAIECCVDPVLATAIGMTENEQRPAWFRRAERSLSWLHSKGSFGLFQVQGHGPVSDEESCRIALRRLAGSWPLLAENKMAIQWSVARLAERHNPDTHFGERVYQQYLETWPQRVAATDAEGGDRRPLVDVWSVGRFGDHLRARGTYWSAAGVVTVRVLPLGSTTWKPVPARFVNQAGPRAAWFAEIPPDAAALELRWGTRRPKALTVDLRAHNVVRREVGLRTAAT